LPGLLEVPRGAPWRSRAAVDQFLSRGQLATIADVFQSSVLLTMRCPAAKPILY